MTELLHWFDLSEWPALVVLIFLLVFVGEKMARPGSATYRQARRLAAVALVLYAVCAIVAWRPSSPQELLGIVLRALFAAGIAYGTSLLILAAVHHAIGDPIAVLAARYRRWQDECELRDAAAQRRREVAESARKQEAAHAEQARLGELARQRQADEAASDAQRREEEVSEARAEVERYYNDHADLMDELLPRAHFRSKLESRFAGQPSREQAWQAAQELIAEIVPLVDESRQRRAKEADEFRQREQHAERLRRQIRKLEEEIQQLSESSTFDAEVIGPEIVALKEQIRELEEELAILPCPLPENQS